VAYQWRTIVQELVRFVSSNKVATLNAVGLLLISIGVLLLFQRQHRYDWWSWVGLVLILVALADLVMVDLTQEYETILSTKV
jgi:steroid 5-alpha reductase family enzyme